ncbi:helix-turn-helix transcriptional regulator [Streptomyces roseoverticillatus]|uniref:helix-turn-helix transcriptional regulator n=1 Tax=Streptomyces roseoverticillatus TaxID=66429 RepID=UPI0006934F41|nr:LuxR family transcriptional regulator [Streptomyces roseoverticillatus]
MHDILKAAGAGRGQSILIEGTAGMGRTRLLRHAMDQAGEHGLHLLSARARASEQDVEYSVAQQLIAGARTLLAGTAPEADGPVTWEAHQGCPAPYAAHPAPGSAALHPLARLLSSGTPLMLAVDDLQWADTASLRCLGYLMARLENTPVAVVATVALGETPGDPVLAEVLSSFRHRTLLRGLSAEDTARVAADAFAAPDLAPDSAEAAPDLRFVEACRTATGGSPYLLEALFRVMRLHGLRPDARAADRIGDLAPVEVADTLLPRYDRAYPGAAAVLQAVAVLDGSATTAVIARLLGLDALGAADVVDSLVRAGALTGEDGVVRFARPVLRTAVLARVPPSRRDALHARAAQLLHESGAPAERVAAQLLRVRSTLGLHWTCTVLYTAAGEVMQRGDTGRARAYLHRGLEECEGACRGKLLRALGRIELAADPAAAVEHLRSALALEPDADCRADIRLCTAHALQLLGRPEEAERVLLEGVAEARGAEEDTASVLRAERCLLRELNAVDTVVDAVVEADCAGAAEPLPPAATATPGERHTRLSLAALRSSRRGEGRDRAVHQARQALQEEHVSLDWRIATRTVPLQVLARADELDLALSECRALLDRARAEGSRTLLTIAHSMRAEVRYRSGDVAGCLEDARAALEPAGASPCGHWSRTGQAMAAVVAALLETGELREANRALSDFGLDADVPEGAHFAALLFHRGRLRVACGHPQAGLADLLECGRRLGAAGQLNPSVLSWRSEAALVHAALGERDAALALVDEELGRARRWGGRRATGRALRAAGLLAKGLGGEEALREAVEVLEDSAARLDLARALTDLGILMRKSSRLGEAREHLRRAQSLAEQCGAAVLAQTARQELLAAGARPRRPTEVGIDALTPTERRVALMAVAKFTNREIAAKMFVTQRTVELHLSRVYRKLAVTGRSGLAEYFARPESGSAASDRPECAAEPAAWSGARAG